MPNPNNRALAQCLRALHDCFLQEKNQPFPTLSPIPGMLQTHERVESLVQSSRSLIFILIQLSCSLGKALSVKLSPRPDFA